MTKKTAVFWHVTTCSLVEHYKNFGGAWCLHLQGQRQQKSSSIYLFNSAHSALNVTYVYTQMQVLKQFEILHMHTEVFWDMIHCSLIVHQTIQYDVPQDNVLIFIAVRTSDLIYLHICGCQVARTYVATHYTFRKCISMSHVRSISTVTDLQGICINKLWRIYAM
jgi:hypothetical protein